MRKLTLFSLIGLFLFALSALLQASVQTAPLEPGPFCPFQDPVINNSLVPAEDTGLGTCTEFCPLGVPCFVMDACVGWVGLGPQGTLTFSDLTASPGLHRHTLPEPATIAVWSLIGLCWSGVSCWRRRRGLNQSGDGWDRSRTPRRMSRPPWPDHVRKKFLKSSKKAPR